MKRLDVDDNTAVSMPVRNLLTIIGACLVGAWFGFGVLERLNNIESDLRLIHKDLEAANTFIDSVPKGGMVSPQVQELYMLVEYLGENVLAASKSLCINLRSDSIELSRSRTPKPNQAPTRQAPIIVSKLRTGIETAVFSSTSNLFITITDLTFLL